MFVAQLKDRLTWFSRTIKINSFEIEVVSVLTTTTHTHENKDETEIVLEEQLEEKNHPVEFCDVIILATLNGIQTVASFCPLLMHS